MTELHLQKSPGRGEVYHRPPGIWFSEQLKRWMVTSPDIIRRIMHDDNFAVPEYHVSGLIEHFGIDLHTTGELMKWFPLALEGEAHRMMREMFARHIAANSRAALAALSAEWETRAAAVFARPAGMPFCLYRELLRPVVTRAVLRLADIDVPLDTQVEALPQMFDDLISISRRRRINDVATRVIEGMQADLPEDEKYLRAAVLVLSSNTLLGSVSLTIAETLRSSPDAPLNAISWSSNLLRTGLPLVEKRALNDCVLDDVRISAGDQFRLFIEADGVSSEGFHAYSDLFFAAGNHKCVGMNFSKQAWTAVASLLGRVDRKLRLIDVQERAQDYVFNYPERMMVEFHD